MTGEKKLARPFDVRTERNGDAVFIRLSGEFDLSCQGHFEGEVARATCHRPGCLIVDLRTLTFMDSSGLRMLLEAYGQSREERFDFKVIPGRREVQRVLELTGLDDVLPLVPS